MLEELGAYGWSAMAILSLLYHNGARGIMPRALYGNLGRGQAANAT